MGNFFASLLHNGLSMGAAYVVSALPVLATHDPTHASLYNAIGVLVGFAVRDQLKGVSAFAQAAGTVPKGQ